MTDELATMVDEIAGVPFHKIYDFTTNLLIGRDRIRLDHLVKTMHSVKRMLPLVGDLSTEDQTKLKLCAVTHDLLKINWADHLAEHPHDKETETIILDHVVPIDLNRYVRLNLDTLEFYGLDNLFNTDIQLHSLASGIFLIKEFGIVDSEILYPVFFHSCPILEIYRELDSKLQLMVDIMVLADKLSSARTKEKVNFDLETVVFGESKHEFNFTLGVFLARLISQGNSTESHSLEMTRYYWERLVASNPLLHKFQHVPKLKSIRRRISGKESSDQRTSAGTISGNSTTNIDDKPPE